MQSAQIDEVVLPVVVEYLPTKPYAACQSLGQSIRSGGEFEHVLDGDANVAVENEPAAHNTQLVEPEAD
jgi:hypothetical protein